MDIEQPHPPQSFSIPTQKWLDERIPALSARSERVQAAIHSHGMPWETSIIDSSTPPFYLDFWKHQIAFMEQHLTNLRPLPVTSRNGKDLSLILSDDGSMRMHTLLFASDEYRLIRLTLMDGRVQVFTSVWYPQPEYNLPILGCDLLQFGGQKHLCLMDFQPICAAESDHDRCYEHRMQPIRNRFELLHSEMSDKHYDASQYFSSQMLIGRAHGAAEAAPMMTQMSEAFQEYVHLHTRMVQSSWPESSQREEVLARQASYDMYSAQRDPAHPMLARAFGQEIADAYVYDILFPLATRV